MTTTPEESAPVPRSLFQVTHYLRPAQANSGWSQSQSAELSYADAQDWIYRQHVEAKDLGFTDGPAVAAADPTPAPSAGLSAAPADGSASTSPASPDLGDS